MANYKPTEKGQSLLLAVNLSDQIISGTFEHTMQKLIDNKLDLRIFEQKSKTQS